MNRDAVNTVSILPHVVIDTTIHKYCVVILHTFLPAVATNPALLRHQWRLAFNICWYYRDVFGIIVDVGQHSAFGIALQWAACLITGPVWGFID